MPSKERPVTDFLPCSHCHGFYVQEELWRHSKNHECRSSEDVVKDGKPERTSVIVAARLTLEGANTTGTDEN